MNTDIQRTRGAQPGNQNARKHGYYSTALSGAGKRKLNQAAQVYGLDGEIALLRASLKAVVEQDPTNVRLISEAASTLARLMRTSEKLGFARPGMLDPDPCLENLDDIVANL